MIIMKNCNVSASSHPLQIRYTNEISESTQRQTCVYVCVCTCVCVLVAKILILRYILI